MTKLSVQQLAAIENGPPVANPNDRDRGGCCRSSRLNGFWAEKVGGFDPVGKPETLSPFMAVKNVTADYPPALMIHGTEVLPLIAKFVRPPVNTK